MIWFILMAIIGGIALTVAEQAGRRFGVWLAIIIAASILFGILGSIGCLLVLIFMGPVKEPSSYPVQQDEQRYLDPSYVIDKLGRPNWYEDPHYEAEYRWWNGKEWTNKVMSRDVVSYDDIGAPYDAPPTAPPYKSYGASNGSPQSR